MSELIVWLAAAVTILVAANIIVSLVPKRNSSPVRVAFIPPVSSMVSTSLEAKLDAHVQSTNQKISQLFLRMEELEKHIKIAKETIEAGDQTWMETIPIRNKKPKSKKNK